ncbi:hypothetical protein [Deinococcus multiflagellatus]|uniref:Uncharacterized protein n=1 Tax=Deinococcus multiflagellatus TaxID=1656887 RepID=A0ABW1ZEE1_9DEIO
MVEPGTVTELNAGDSSRASHVWRVETAAGPEIWRRAWWTEPEVSAFMLGLGQLFGVDPATCTPPPTPTASGSS